MPSVIFPLADWVLLASHECMEQARKAYAAKAEQEFQHAMRNWTRVTAIEFERLKNGR